MRFYHIEQYGKRCLCHSDKAYSNDKGLKEVTTRIVEKAQKAVEKGLMAAGAFDVIVCDKYGKEIDHFISATDLEYSPDGEN